MTLYEELYYQLSDLPKFYRYEGLGSFTHFSFKEQTLLPRTDNYVYFSINSKHHFYYVAKRLKQLINKEMLYETKYTITKNVVVNNEKYQEIMKNIENAPLEEKPMSIEFVVSPLIKQLLTNNYIRNFRKEHGDYRVERVDNAQSGGGYGFYGEWLAIFKVLTYMYAYQKITKEDLINYVYAFRQKVINPKLRVSNVSFLSNPNKRVVTLNETLKNDFSKYELMNALESTLEKELFFSESYLGTKGSEGIKKIVQDFSLERETILALLEENYKRRLIKEL